ncbi:hypothetical protein EXIGLDRAFT_611897 [Exidia glandulosa HHB12029]|uniref:C2H2-type domain-containing protein n=1 Tax=Exidia glandulosa HHB12029 TaxID=1314781 RepID=A0A165J411_EXIGL|nr:hypothetical protein EXIGLDRAFT_611897 [Exidia glandulosa HHB12029]
MSLCTPYVHRSRYRTCSRNPDLPTKVDLSYTCDVCGAFFRRKCDGERHYRSHTGARPFNCYGGCKKAFRRADGRSRHWAVYPGCELQHKRNIKGTPEGLRLERLILKRQTRVELVAQGASRLEIDRVLRRL